ncbi:MAG: metal-dependent hydrolase [Clostridia bacterium]|nr:metal-dependent hydrolase [Clostridia bacterium]
MKITFLGHAAFLMEGSKTILIDPFLSSNPACPVKPSEIKCDYILVSHGHNDHLGDALEISRQNKAPIIAVFELARYCQQQGALAHPLHIGGGHNFAGTYIKTTPAWHGNSVEAPDGSSLYTGVACGFIINLDGKVIYHAGDTGLFGDLALLGRMNTLDLALLPSGDNFTMGPEDALEAVKMLQSPVVIPMHYNTFPLIAQDAQLFKQKTESQTSSRVIILEPGQSWEL